jgi:hypothetical protein
MVALFRIFIFHSGMMTQLLAALAAQAKSRSDSGGAGDLLSITPSISLDAPSRTIALGVFGASGSLIIL